MGYSKNRPLVGAVVNLKGGVSKTATTACLAGALKSQGVEVLVISFDPQKANIDDHLSEVELEDHPGSFDVLTRGRALVDHIVTTSSGIDLVPAGDLLREAEFHLANKQANRNLQQAIARLPPRYGAVLIDCGPNLGALTLNAMYAANQLIIPVHYDRPALRGLTQLMEKYHEVRQHNPGLRIGGVLPTNFDTRTLVAREYETDFVRIAGRDLLPMVRRDTKVKEAWNNHVSVQQYDPTTEASLTYLKVAKLLWKKVA